MKSNLEKPDKTALIPVYKSLSQWFERQKRVLPWRDEPTPYRVWISEVMLQQTQVISVIPYFEQFINTFPTVSDLANADEDSVIRSWAGLGYYSRARNLQKTAKMIVKLGGFKALKEMGIDQLKRTWLSFSGVGPYTAGAICSIAYDHPEPILDGNVERVLSRYYKIDRKEGDLKYKFKLWEISNLWIKESSKNGIRPSLFNQALMELGALVCKPKNPSCPHCPLYKHCGAFSGNETHLFPPKKARPKALNVVETKVCIVNSDGHVLLQKKKKGEWQEGTWDIPELSLQMQLLDQKSLGKILTKHVVTHHKILRTTYVVSMQNFTSNQFQLIFSQADSVWTLPHQPSVGVNSACRKTLSQLTQLF